MGLMRSHVLLIVLLYIQYLECALCLTADSVTTVSVMVDDYFTLYMDGVQNISGRSAGTTFVTTAPRLVCLFAVDAIDGGGSGWGILVISDIISTMSLSTWRCIKATLVPNMNWLQVGYDDSSWPAATNSGSTFHNSIWAAGSTGMDHVYCRGKTVCYSSPCGNGHCYNVNSSSYQCICEAGYTGTQCQTDIAECASSPCQNSVNCTDKVNGYTCHCVDGYTGVNCATDINECASSPCRNAATCTDQINGYTCRCIGGYTGLNCESDSHVSHTEVSALRTVVIIYGCINGIIVLLLVVIIVWMNRRIIRMNASNKRTFGHFELPLSRQHKPEQDPSYYNNSHRQQGISNEIDIANEEESPQYQALHGAAAMNNDTTNVYNTIN